MLSKSLSPWTFGFITAFDRLSWTQCWGFLSAYFQAGKLFVHFINLQRRTINYKSCRERVFFELARYIVLELKNFLHLLGQRKESRILKEGRGEVYTSKIKSKFLISRLGQQMEKLFSDQINDIEWKKW